MPTYFMGNPPDHPQLPLLGFFSGLGEGWCGNSGIKLVGTLTSLADIDALVPAPNFRVELEYCEGEEEVRVVDDTTGEFHQATGNVAKSLLEAMKARQAVDLAEDGNYPGGGHRRPDRMDLVYIQYDGEGKRLYPALRLGGICHTKEEFDQHAGGNVFWDEKDPTVDTCEDYILVVDTTTGDYWVASPGLTRQMRERRKENKARYMKDHPEEFDEDGKRKGECEDCGTSHEM
jgi:hypothetical protein